jgi:hypothetical protein
MQKPHHQLRYKGCKQTFAKIFAKTHTDARLLKFAFQGSSTRRDTWQSEQYSTTDHRKQLLTAGCASSLPLSSRAHKEGAVRRTAPKSRARSENCCDGSSHRRTWEGPFSVVSPKETISAARDLISGPQRKDKSEEGVQKMETRLRITSSWR